MDRGPTPIYIGFGSMANARPRRTLSVLRQAVPTEDPTREQRTLVAWACDRTGAVYLLDVRAPEAASMNALLDEVLAGASCLHLEAR